MRMSSSTTLRARLTKARAEADRAAETAAQAHETAAGSALVDEALDELVTARRAVWTLERHLDVALTNEAQQQTGGAA